MTSPANALVAAKTGLFLLALWGVYFVALKGYHIDAFRQRLFNLRGELFDLAISEGLSFDHPAYGILRSRINRLIRYAEHFNSLHLVLLFLVVDRTRLPEPHREWLAALDSVTSEDTRRRLLDIEDRMAVLMVKRLISSPFILPVFVVVGVCLVVKGAATATMKSLSTEMPGLELLEGQAEVKEMAAA